MKAILTIIDDRGKKYIGEIELHIANKKRDVKNIPAHEKKHHDKKLSLPKTILVLRDEASFFNEPRTDKDVHDRLSQKDYRYPCDINRVSVALLRLNGRKKLRLTSKNINGKKYQAFVW